MLMCAYAYARAWVSALCVMALDSRAFAQLLSRDMRREESFVLQFVHHIVESNFFLREGAGE